MTNPDWRDTHHNDPLDTPSLWINFMEFPASLDTEQSILKNNTAPQYQDYLFTPPAPQLCPPATPAPFRHRHSSKQTRSARHPQRQPRSPRRHSLHTRHYTRLHNIPS